MFSAILQEDKILLFGGIVSYNNILNDLVELNLSPLSTDFSKKDCKNCNESKLEF